MGFTVYYRSTRRTSPAEVDAIERAANELCQGRTWLGCEPVWFYSGAADGRLFGGSKPNFQPHPLDVASAASSGLPNGTTHDLLDVLCQLSREHRIDWEISHDESNGPIGYIRGGVCDDAVLAQIGALADLGDVLGDLMGDVESQGLGFPSTASGDSDRDTGEGDGDGPPILSFKPKQE